MRGRCLLGHVVSAAGGNRAIKAAVDLHPVSVDALCRVFLCRLAFQAFRAVQGPWIYAYAAYAMSACLPQACILINILCCCAHAILAPFACSSHIHPCRSSSFVHTRRVLAPSHCLSRTGRRRRPNSAGGPEDDDISDDGNDGGTGGSDGGGDDFGGEPWYGDDDANSRGSFGLLGLWQTFCMCSLILVRLACFSFMLAMPNHSLLGVALLRWCSP